MAEVFSSFGDVLIQAYDAAIGALPTPIQKFAAFFIIALVIVLYALIIWKFYQSISHKNIISLNLNKYNKSKQAFLTKVVAGGLYLLEYILILPFLIFVWFTILTMLLIVITEGLEINTLLIIAGTVIASIRMTSYYNQSLSQDIAKLVPLTLLSTSLLNPQFFSVERILGMFGQLPTLFGQITIYLVFIIILEIILRLFDFLFSLFQLEEPKIGKKKNHDDEDEEEED